MAAQTDLGPPGQLESSYVNTYKADQSGECVCVSKQLSINRNPTRYPVLRKGALVGRTGAGTIRGEERRGERGPDLLLAVLQHVLVLGELLVLLRFDALGLVPQPVGVLLLQPLDGLLLLPLQVLHLLVVLSLLTLVWGRGHIKAILAFSWGRMSWVTAKKCNVKSESKNK